MTDDGSHTGSAKIDWTRCSSTSRRSANGRAWRDRLDERGSARALAIAQRHGVPELLARILAGRGVEVDEVESFLDPTVKRLMPDPHVLTGMEAAATRIADAVGSGEKIAIFGDYDVDGATSSALLARFLRAGGLDPIVYIPDRIFEGYGPNVDAIRGLAERGAKLLITVDCGTTSLEPLAEARKLGFDVVVIDHHQADEHLPDALVVNPEPPRRSFGAWPSRRRRPRVHDGGGGQPHPARARVLDRGTARARSARLSRHRRARHGR